MNYTSISVNLALTVYSELLLLFLCIAALRRANHQPTRSQHTYLAFIMLAAVIIASDFVSRLDGSSGNLLALCKAGNLLLFLCNPVLGILWYLYVCAQIELEDQTRKPALWVQIFLCCINAAVVCLTPRTGWVYTFDAQNVYHRGPWFLLTSATLIGVLICTEAVLIRHRHKTDRTHFLALFFFPVIPTVCTLVQAGIYGLALGLHGTVLSLLIVSYYVQDRSLDVDYLTGLYNRRKLDVCMQQKISAARSGKPFSAIYLDINHFKSINDALGHQTGDSALVEAANLLRSVLRADTFVARFGGDEFCILLDMDNPEILHKITERIREGAKAFNKKAGRLYMLTFSIGGTAYTDPNLTLEGFQRQIDALMYRDKQACYAAEGDCHTAVIALPGRRAGDRTT